MHYIQNPSGQRVVLAGKSHFCTSTGGRFLDRLKEEDRALVRDGTICWEWDLNVRPLFDFAFGGSSDVIDSFGPMFDAARKVSNDSALKAYGHNLADAAQRNSVTVRSVLVLDSQHDKNACRRQRNTPLPFAGGLATISPVAV